MLETEHPLWLWNQRPRQWDVFEGGAVGAENLAAVEHPEVPVVARLHACFAGLSDVVANDAPAE